MESRRWVIAAFAALATLSLACKGSGSQPSSSALPVTTLTPTASPRTTGTAQAGSAGIPGTPVRPATGAPLVPSTPSGAAPAAVPAGAVLLQQQGVGSGQTPTVQLQTETFIAPGSWDLQWRYDCSGLGRAGNLSIDVFRGDGGYVNIPPSLAQLGNGGQGVVAYSIAGPLYLVINSVCGWSVTVVTAARPTATPAGSSSVPAAPPTAAPGSAPVATATAVATATSSSSSSSGLAALAGGRPIINPAISTPISPIQQSQGIFARPGGSSARLAATPAAGAIAAGAVTQATALPVAVTVAPAAGAPGH